MLKNVPNFNLMLYAILLLYTISFAHTNALIKPVPGGFTSRLSAHNYSVHKTKITTLSHSSALLTRSVKSEKRFKRSFLNVMPSNLKKHEDVELLNYRTSNKNYLPSCYAGGGEGEWGEREIATKWTKGYCSSVLEFGGGAGSVSSVVQASLDDPYNHVVIQPDDVNVMFGGLKTLLKNKKACDMKFTEVDHVLESGELKILRDKMRQPFDCIIADCENCLPGEFTKNPDLFDGVKYIQVERDDGKMREKPRGPYTKLFEENGFTHVDTGHGCNGVCYTEVWAKDV